MMNSNIWGGTIMTKIKMCVVLNISIPTLDKKLKEGTEVYLFLMSYTKFKYLDRIKRIKLRLA